MNLITGWSFIFLKYSVCACASSWLLLSTEGFKPPLSSTFNTDLNPAMKLIFGDDTCHLKDYVEVANQWWNLRTPLSTYHLAVTNMIKRIILKDAMGLFKASFLLIGCADISGGLNQHWSWKISWGLKPLIIQFKFANSWMQFVGVVQCWWAGKFASNFENANSFQTIYKDIYMTVPVSSVLRLAMEFSETTPGKQLKLEKSNCGSIK